MPQKPRATRTVVPDLRDLVNTAQAQTLTQFSRRHIYRLTADGLLPVYKIGGRNRYSIHDLQALVKRGDAA